MIKVTKILEQGGACPFQLLAQTECGRKIYLRYRGGLLRFGFLNANKIVPDEYIFSKLIGDRLDGSPDDAEFKNELAAHIEWPEVFNFKINEVN